MNSLLLRSNLPNHIMMKKILTLLMIFCYKLDAFASTYNGSPYWHAPETVICSGLPDYPEGLKFSPYKDQVFGMSGDFYFFIYMDGALGLYYFKMAMQNNETNFIDGTATYIDSSEWKNKTFQVRCKVMNSSK